MARIAILSQALSPTVRITGALRGLGHEPVGVVAPAADRAQVCEIVEHAPPELDVLVAARRDRLAPLLRALEPDVAVCSAFPWKVPADALAVPPLGILNGHPAVLPAYRGPVGDAWAIRNGERDLGFTWHLMDEDFDTGPILAQEQYRLDDGDGRDDFAAKLASAAVESLATALARRLAGDRGVPQEGGAYWPFFEEEYVWIDWSRPAAEVQTQVRAWWRGLTADGIEGPLAELRGETVRVLGTRLSPGRGVRRECGDGPIWIVETEPAYPRQGRPLFEPSQRSTSTQAVTRSSSRVEKRPPV